MTWLNGDHKPQRQSYGDVKGSFVELEKLDYAKPPENLLIGEGVETVLSGMQLTGFVGIASAGAWEQLWEGIAQRFRRIFIDQEPSRGINQ